MDQGECGAPKQLQLECGPKVSWKRPKESQNELGWVWHTKQGLDWDIQNQTQTQLGQMNYLVRDLAIEEVMSQTQWAALRKPKSHLLV